MNQLFPVNCMHPRHHSEMSHATACWMTGSKVLGIEVYGDEGGVMKYVGGWQWFIIPTGIHLQFYIVCSNIFIYTSKISSLIIC